jgi:cold shock CspA family protein
MHQSAVTEAGFRASDPGQTVEYELQRPPKGPPAVGPGPGHER